MIESMAQLRELVRVILEEGASQQTITAPMTAEQLAAATGQHPDTIRRRIRSGAIKRVPATRKMLVPAQECERILKGIS